MLQHSFDPSIVGFTIVVLLVNSFNLLLSIWLSAAVSGYSELRVQWITGEASFPLCISEKASLHFPELSLGCQHFKAGHLSC